MFRSVFPPAMVRQRPLFKFVISTMSPSTTVKLQKRDGSWSHVNWTISPFLSRPPPAGLRQRLLCAFIIATRPLGAAAAAGTGIVRAKAMAGMERERMDLITLFMTKFSFLLIVSCATERRTVDSLEIRRPVHPRAY